MLHSSPADAGRTPVGIQQTKPESVHGGQSRLPFLYQSRADQYPGPRLAGDGSRGDRLQRRAVPRHHRGVLRRPEAGVQDRPDDPRLCRIRPRCVGGRTRQPVLTRRQAAGRRERLFLAQLGNARRSLRARGRDLTQRLADRRRSGEAGEPPARGPRARDQGGAGGAQRDLDRGRQRHRRIAPGDRCGPAPGAVSRRYDLVPGVDGFSHG